MKRSAAAAISDAVLYEGYLLYPYRESAIKNQYRWTFGCLFPESWCRQCGNSERDRLHAEFPVAVTPRAEFDIHLRCLVLPSDQVPGEAQPVERQVVSPLKGLWANWIGGSIRDEVDTTFDRDRLVELLRGANTLPEGFGAHAKITRLFKQRHALIDAGTGLDWALGEQAAFATLLADGFRVRPVDPRVNSPRFEDPQCLGPPPQLALFDS